MTDRESLPFSEPEPQWADSKAGLCFIAFGLCVIAWAVIKWLT